MPTIGHNRNPGHEAHRRMYAIVFDFDTSSLEAAYPNQSWRNAYIEVRKVLEVHGFDWQQGSTYFGNESVQAVNCFLAVQDLTRKFPWFAPAIRDIRMLRIEENNDLLPIVESI
jgi:virulence-associated protein VapD